MASEDLEIANQFRVALELAVRTGDREALFRLLAPDVEWITPQRTLRGIDQLREWRILGSQAESFDFDFGVGEWTDHGGGRVSCQVDEVYRLKDDSGVAYERERHIDLTIRDGKISRYEMGIVG